MKDNLNLRDRIRNEIVENVWEHDTTDNILSIVREVIDTKLKSPLNGNSIGGSPYLKGYVDGVVDVRKLFE